MGEAVNKLFPFINFIFRMGAGLSEVLPYGERQISVYFFQFEYKIELDIPFSLYGIGFVVMFFSTC